MKRNNFLVNMSMKIVDNITHRLGIMSQHRRFNIEIIKKHEKNHGRVGGFPHGQGLGTSGRGQYVRPECKELQVQKCCPGAENCVLGTQSCSLVTERISGHTEPYFLGHVWFIFGHFCSCSTLSKCLFLIQGSIRTKFHRFSLDLGHFRDFTSKNGCI